MINSDYKSPFESDQKTTVMSSQMQPSVSWSQYARSLPLVCGIKTLNAELTIYACLQQAYKQFDYIVITDDGSTDDTFKMVQKCCKDFQIQNIVVLDMSKADPWPDQTIEKKEGDHHITRELGKTHAKAQWKSFNIIKKNFPNSIYVSLEDDVILYENIRSRIYNRVVNWKEPHTDSEFFNVIQTIDKYRLLPVKGYGFHPGMNQRKTYDNAGDYTLACWWTSGKLNIMPDPVYAFGACLDPWLQKNQTGKKGQCNDEPYGYHMLCYRTSKIGYSYKHILKEGYDFMNIQDVAKEDKSVNSSLLDDVWFPKELSLNKDYEIIVEKNNIEEFK